MENIALIYVYGNNAHAGTAEYGENRTRRFKYQGLEVGWNAGNEQHL